MRVFVIDYEVRIYFRFYRNLCEWLWVENCSPKCFVIFIMSLITSTLDIQRVYCLLEDNLRVYFNKMVMRKKLEFSMNENSDNSVFDLELYVYVHVNLYKHLWTIEYFAKWLTLQLSLFINLISRLTKGCLAL